MSGQRTSLHEKKSLGGRPSEHGEAKRSPLSLRTTATVRGALEAAAKGSGLSIAQEVERRLMISLADDERAGGVLQGDLIRGMLLVMNSTSRSLGTDWWTDHDGWRIVAANISGLLKDLEPERAEPVPPFDPEAMAAHEVEYQAWEKRELYPLRERRNELAEKRKGRGSRITEAEEAEYHEVNRKIRQVVRSGGPKPNLSPKELERWEVERARDYRVRRAWLQATAATPSLFHEPSEYDYGA